MGKSRRSFTAKDAVIPIFDYAVESTKSYLQRNAKSIAKGALNYATRNSNVGKSRLKPTMYATRNSGTQTMRRRYRRNTTARSAGFFRKGKSVKKIRRTRVAKVSNGGVELTAEYGGTYSNTNCQFIGHITHPVANVLRMAWAAIVKELLFKAGWTLASWDEPLNLLEDTQIIVTYKIGSNFVPAQAKPFQATGAFISFNDLVSYFALPTGNNPGSGTTCPWADPSNESRDWQFTRIQFLTTTTNIDTIFHPAFLDLNECMISTYTKSTLKMQNRSVTVALDNEADDVNNVPVHGKSYSGSGTGAFYSYIPGTTASFYGASGTGVIDTVGVSSNGTEEPPQPWHFNKIKNCAKVKLDPGELKTSTLIHKQNINFSRLFNMINPWSTTFSKPIRQLGKYRFFAWEKILDCQASIPVSISFEHNISYAYKAMCYRRRFTTEKTEINNYI